MSSFGSLTFYGKNGLSDPYSLSYGKTTIGSSSNHHIRIRGDNQIACVLDTNEFGVTTLINEFENENVCVNDVPTLKYTILKDGDHIEFGKKKFKYSNPSLKETYVEQTQQTLIKKCGISENLGTKLDIPSKLLTPLKSFQAANSSKRRFSTGCKITEVKSSPKITKKNSSHTSTPQSATKVRFSQRMVARRNSTLASVKENEVYDFHNPVVNFVASPIPKKRASFLAGVESPLAKKNNTFAGSSEFTSPLPSKNKTYSGNISDVSDNVTTPENIVTAAAITPLNVSKKSKKSLSRSRTLSYVDFPDNSSTPKSAIKMNRSSSLYKPIVEDITPASPLPRSSLRNSSLKLPAFTQRRSVNVSSASENDSLHSLNLALEEETSLSGRKRSRNESFSEYPENAKRRKSGSFHGFDEDEHDQNSLHDSSLSGIHNLSDTSFHSNKNQNVSASNSFKDVHDLEDQSMVSWHEEMSHNDPTQCLDSAMTSASSMSRSRRSSVREPMGKSNVGSKSLNLDRKISKSTDKHSKTLGAELDSAHGVSDPSDCVETAMNFSSSFTSPRPRRSGARVEKSGGRSKSLNFDRKINRSTGKHSKTLGDKLTLSDEEISPNELTGHAESSSSRSRTLIKKNKSNVRSKSLNLDRKKIKSSDKHSKTLGNNLIPASSDEESMSSLQPSLFDQSLETSDDNLGQISSTPLVKTTSKSLCSKTKSPVFKTRSKSLIAGRRLSGSICGPSKTTKRASLNVSPIAVSSSVLKRLRNSSSRALSSGAAMHTSKTRENSTLNSTKKLFGSLLDASLPDYNDSTNKLFESNKDSLTPRRLTRTSKILKSFSSKTSSLESDTSIGNSTTTSVFKTPKRPTLESKSSSSFITSDNDSESLRVSKTVSFCDSSSVEDVALNTNKSTPGKLFKSPRAKTPNKLATPSKTVSDPTDVRSMEKLFEKSLEKSPTKKITPSNSLEESLENLEDQESITSLSESFESVPAGKTTPYMMTREKKTPKNNSIGEAGVKEVPKKPKTPQNDLSDVAGVRELLRTPRMRSSPKNDLSNVVGVKKIMATPKIPNSPRNDLTDVAGVKKLLRTPKAPQSPYNDLTDIKGVKKLLKTPKVQKSPQNDLTSIKGVKKLLRTPKVQKSPKNDLTNIKGVKKLLKTPKVQKSPRNDLTNVAGVKKLLKSPVAQKSPKNDLTNIKGVKKLMTTPKIQNSPKNDLTNVAGVKKLMSTPKEQKSPRNDLTQIAGLKKLMASPKQQKTPKNNLADVKGINKIFKTPRAQKEPKNDLLDVRGIKQLLKTPKNKAADESHDLSGIDILFNESQENSFDKLRDKKPVRTYGKSPKINKSQEVHVEEVKTPEHVLKWLEDQSQVQHTSPKEIIEGRRGKRRLADAEVLEGTSASPNKKYKPTPKTRSADAKKDQNKSIELNLSCSEKPTSTPIIKRTDSPETSKVEISGNKRQTRQRIVSKSEKVEIEPQTEVKLTRSRRKLQQVEEIEDPPSPKRTRSKREKNSTKENEQLDESNPIPIEKKTTRSTRQAKKKDDSEEKIPEETNTRSLRGKKQIQVNDENDKIEEKPAKRTRSKKETESENPPKEETKQIVNTRTRTNTRSKANVSVNDEIEPNKKGKANKLEEDQDNKNIEDEPAPKRRGRKKKEDEENVKDSVSEVSKRTRGNRAKEMDEISAVIETETKTTRRGRNTKKEVEENNSITEKDSQPIKKSKTNAKEDTEKETSRTTRGKNQKKNQAKNEKDLTETTKQGEDDESTDDKQVPVKKSTRSRKGKNQKYNEEEWDTPVKRKRLVNFNEDVEILQTPKEDSKTGVQKKG